MLTGRTQQVLDLARAACALHSERQVLLPTLDDALGRYARLMAQGQGTD